MDKPKSITHEHLLSIINTEARQLVGIKGLRILDAGCGDGTFLSYLVRNLPLVFSNLSVEAHGFDVFGHGVQERGFLEKAIEFLSVQEPNTDWRKRITSVSLQERWPYEDEFFDVIVSNQVIEHVDDHALFFSENHRTLKRDGVSIHLFPLKNCVFENHLKLPLVHKIRNFDLLRSYIRALSRLRLGKFRTHHRDYGMPLEEYAERHADYMHYFTNYISYGEVLQLAKKYRLRASFKYTRELYIRRLRSFLSLTPKFEYPMRRPGLFDFLFVLFARYISIVTLFLQKRETYRRA